jgi:hypothetical protein
MKSKARSPFRWPAPTRRPYPFWHGSAEEVVASAESWRWLLRQLVFNPGEVRFTASGHHGTTSERTLAVFSSGFACFTM